MGKVYEQIDDRLSAWIAEQPMFFVATAPLSAEGHVNVSPRGHDTLSVLGPHRIGWIDYTGSGVETIGHLQENCRICVMFCAFTNRPRIVRIHGRGRVAYQGDSEFVDLVSRHPAHPSTRAAIIVDVTRISDACGFGVPVMALVGERDLLAAFADKRGPDGMAEYRAERNAVTIDGMPGIPRAR